MDRKRELKALYKEMKPEMGIFLVQCLKNNKCYLETAQYYKSRINSIQFQLDFGNFSNRELQRDWQQYGSENFKFAVLEQLDYDQDALKTDYSEELEILYQIWSDKLANQNVELYNKE